MGDKNTLGRLAETIHAKRQDSAASSYTRQLLDAGTERCAKKFGEEAVETVLAAMSANPDHLKAEAADTLYHLLVLLELRGVDFADVLAVLESRTGRGGLDEKNSRPRG